jgi:hypothetical protein
MDARRGVWAGQQRHKFVTQVLRSPCPSMFIIIQPLYRGLLSMDVGRGV